MNAPAVIPARAQRIADNFTVHRQRDGGKAQALTCEGGCLADVLRDAEAQSRPKDMLFVLHTDGLSGERLLHAYAVKASTKVFTFREAYDGGRPVRVPKAEAKLLFSLPVSEFAPVEPWRWTPGADVVGIDRETINAR